MNHYKKMLFIVGATVSFLCVCGCATMNGQRLEAEIVSRTPVPNVITLEYTKVK